MNWDWRHVWAHVKRMDAPNHGAMIGCCKVLAWLGLALSLVLIWELIRG